MSQEARPAPAHEGGPCSEAAPPPPLLFCPQKPAGEDHQPSLLCSPLQVSDNGVAWSEVWATIPASEPPELVLHLQGDSQVRPPPAPGRAGVCPDSRSPEPEAHGAQRGLGHAAWDQPCSGSREPGASVSPAAPSRPWERALRGPGLQRPVLTQLSLLQDGWPPRTIPLSGCTVSVSDPGEGPDTRHVWRLQQAQRSLYLSALSADLRQHWLDALSAAARGDPGLAAP